MVEKRKITQFAATFLYNAHLKGFPTGMIYRGGLKNICVPGLNCYSCPGAIGSCPIGTLQSSMGSSPLLFPFYAIGFFLLFGVLLGRFICGWLCPFGLLQELLHKLPSRKKRLRNQRLPLLRYAIFAIFVLFIPIYTMATKGYVVPGFCKYICPAGTMEAGWPLVLANAPIRASIGGLFWWKTLLAVGIIVLAAQIFRPFCRYVCPLGLILGWFNRISLVSIQCLPERCTGCGGCKSACKLELEPEKEVCSPECILCGECAAYCPQRALCFTIGGRVLQQKDAHTPEVKK